MVFCEDDSMGVTLKRSYLPKQVNINNLHLKDHHCQVGYNKTHIFSTLTLTTTCGTIFQKTDQIKSYTNSLSEEQRLSFGGSESYLFFENFSCSYDRKITVGSLNFRPARPRLLVTRSKYMEGGEIRESIILIAIKGQLKINPKTLILYLMKGILTNQTSIRENLNIFMWFFCKFIFRSFYANFSHLWVEAILIIVTAKVSAEAGLRRHPQNVCEDKVATISSGKGWTMHVIRFLTSLPYYKDEDSVRVFCPVSASALGMRLTDSSPLMI